jgi:primosomal protein N' (replication factor Y)
MTNNPIALHIALPVPLRRLFTYLATSNCNLKDLSPGCRVRVPFQKRELIGILMETTTEPKIAWEKLKPIKEIIDASPIIPEDTWNLCLWAADYYHYPVGEVLANALPLLLRQGKPTTLTHEQYWQLTLEGKDIDLDTFKRAPRQRELMQLFKQHPEGLTVKELKKQTTKNMLNGLVEKGYISVSSKPFSLSTSYKEASAPLILNDEQTVAVKALQASLDTFQVFLLDGVTGSGKTEVYLQTIDYFLSLQKQILVLVPEIGLTPQTLQRFQERFNTPILALHSNLTDKERLNAWLLAKLGEVKIVIGTRSSVFTPFANLGLIIVDEEHDLSFKQQDTFRYHARDVAVMRGHLSNIPVVLGSATPALETLHNAKQNRYQHLRLLKRAGSAKLPEFNVIDIRKMYLDEGLSPTLITTMRQHLDQGEQVMLFLNRRGFAPVLMCHDCGWSVMCKRCDVRMTYHQFPERLHCHHCDAQRKLPTQCEACSSHELHKVGLGTERLEQVLAKHFSDFSIARIDRDSTQRKGSLEDLLEKIHLNEHRILIGTQMLAKGHHFPNVTLVAIVDADGGFFSTDFRAIERMGQLLLQVSGRAGRADKEGKVLIQTRHPDHPLLHQLIHRSYYDFALTLLNEREKAELPPYCYFSLFRAEAFQVSHATTFLKQIKELIPVSDHRHIRILGPISAPLARKAGRHRVQLLIQSTERPRLKRILKAILLQMEKIPSQHRVHWSLDVDPLEMV